MIICSFKSRWFSHHVPTIHRDYWSFLHWTCCFACALCCWYDKLISCFNLLKYYRDLTLSSVSTGWLACYHLGLKDIDFFSKQYRKWILREQLKQYERSEQFRAVRPNLSDFLLCSTHLSDLIAILILYRNNSSKKLRKTPSLKVKLKCHLLLKTHNLHLRCTPKSSSSG